MRIVGLGHGLFAMASAGLAMMILAYGDFAPGQSFAGWLPGREAWVYGSALLLLGASAGLCFPRTALPSLWLIGTYFTAWALLCVPAVLSQPLSIGAWYGVCEALTSLAGAWILYTLLRWQSPESQIPVQIPIAGERAVRAAQVVFGLCCVFYGYSHFAYADYTASMVPAWLPVPLGLAYVTGIGHAAGGIGVVVGILPRLAATLEAIMMSLFGLLVWVPSFFAQPRPTWATPPQNQWSELAVNLVLAAAAFIVATSLRDRPWGLASRSRG
jgi:uncharacterized membrane protein YphA (DoxX/SURF4 family)